MTGKLKRKPKWRDEFYVEGYRLAKEGLSDEQIRQRLGVSITTFEKWKNVRPAFRQALLQARSKDRSHVETFSQFIHGRLPAAAKRLWEEMEQAERIFEEGGDDRRDAVIDMIATQGKRLRQQLFVHALVCSNFQVSFACRRTGISVPEVKGWASKDAGFAELLAGVQQCKKDFFEGALIDLVAKRDSAAVIFVNKTVNKDRGYGESKDDVTRKVQHEHRLVLDELPLEAQKALLEAMKRKESRLLEHKTVDAEVEIK